MSHTMCPNRATRQPVTVIFLILCPSTGRITFICTNPSLFFPCTIFPNFGSAVVQIKVWKVNETNNRRQLITHSTFESDELAISLATV